MGGIVLYPSFAAFPCIRGRANCVAVDIVEATRSVRVRSNARWLLFPLILILHREFVSRLCGAAPELRDTFLWGAPAACRLPAAVGLLLLDVEPHIGLAEVVPIEGVAEPAVRGAVVNVVRQHLHRAFDLALCVCSTSQRRQFNPASVLGSASGPADSHYRRFIIAQGWPSQHTPTRSIAPM